MSEAEFLAQQALEARQAILATLDDLKDDLKTAGDVRLWTERHPWAAVGVAAAAGFAAATAVMPGSDGKAKRDQRWPHLFEQMKETEPDRRREEPGLLGSISRSLFDMGKVVLERAVLTAIQSAAVAGAASQAAEAGAERAEDSPREGFSTSDAPGG